MTIDTQKLREAAQRVISESGDSWYGADQMGGAWLVSSIPETDAMHIEAASPAAIVDLCDILDAANEQVAEYARIFDRIRAEADAKIDALAAESERLRYALRWAAAALQEACRRPTIITPQDRWRIDRETLTTEQILAAADAALQGEPHASDPA